MSYATLQIEQTGAVATLWMNRPERHNAFDAETIADLTGALGALDADALVRVVVLAGRGRSFCAGADIAWMKGAAQAGEQSNLADARRLATLLRLLATLSKPTIARVHGAALGGGLGLAAACDICVASTEAVFATSEVRLGLIPAVIGPYVLRAIGPRQAARYVLTAESISAAQAKAIGLVHETVAAAELDAKIADLAQAILRGGPEALAAAKSLMRDIAAAPLDENLTEQTARRIAATRAGDEAKEGLAAFLAKRPPSWRL
jgi:methylglutaconyl-CoA hydratase